MELEAEEFLNSKDIFNHPRIEDTNNKNSYDVAELLEEFANLKSNEQNRYTQGFLGKKVIYYDNGISMSIEEVLTNLNKLEEVKQSILCEVSRSLPTDTDYLSEVRVKLFDEHVERLSKQTKEWNLMEGIRLGLNAEKK